MEPQAKRERREEVRSANARLRAKAERARRAAAAIDDPVLKADYLAMVNGITDMLDDLEQGLATLDAGGIPLSGDDLDRPEQEPPCGERPEGKS